MNRAVWAWVWGAVLLLLQSCLVWADCPHLQGLYYCSKSMNPYLAIQESKIPLSFSDFNREYSFHFKSQDRQEQPRELPKSSYSVTLQGDPVKSGGPFCLASKLWISDRTRKRISSFSQLPDGSLKKEVVNLSVREKESEVCQRIKTSHPYEMLNPARSGNELVVESHKDLEGFIESDPRIRSVKFLGEKMTEESFLLLLYDFRLAAVRELDFSELKGISPHKYLSILFNLFPNLESLNLSHQRVAEDSQAWKTFVRNLGNLKALTLGASYIGDKGVLALAKALESNANLLYLDLWDNEITDKGGVALAQMLRFNSVIQTLILKSNDIGDCSASFLAAVARHREVGIGLDLSGNRVTIRSVPEFLATYLERKNDPIALNLSLNRLSPIRLFLRSESFWRQQLTIARTQRQPLRWR